MRGAAFARGEAIHVCLEVCTKDPSQFAWTTVCAAVSSRGLGEGLCHCFLQQLEKGFSSLDSSCSEGHPQHLERRGVMDGMNENELFLLQADAPGKLS